ncbi:hypothetical protein VOLCADRAFT_91699 [Volvox carteri f. nagariensis]|uniref:Uncharacterized protein n=1 Tax=Volvox carteri f. nagariensis TaxID=3068 RepID=D8TXS0_VOLCA|nr:uncharacterized protein VOLCADRAFT_91699 [Volvox carteri f. nagariensis]EFJ47773.1 hypothetical protein VOLCADRAFT_91699 [Volvox carteri f. nagariensis]|eukprot:XP_002951244.1 hypothetical protein VOLCADRAFT_91699 [Volvox carteri f. nagariensis]
MVAGFTVSFGRCKVPTGCADLGFGPIALSQIREVWCEQFVTRQCIRRQSQCELSSLKLSVKSFAGKLVSVRCNNFNNDIAAGACSSVGQPDCTNAAFEEKDTARPQKLLPESQAPVPGGGTAIPTVLEV